MEVLAVDLMPYVNNIFHIALAALGLGLVIFLHELGHFAVAKWCNVYVERFSIGFGPVFFSRKWGETEYALSLIPFGGYVKMLGQDDADPSQLTNEEIAEDPRSYVAKSVLQRMAIISAGVTMNVLTAFLFFIIAFCVGFQAFPSFIGDARPGMPAWEAGISPGDQIDFINGSRITTFNDLTTSVQLSTGALRLEGKHADGTPFAITIDPDAKGLHPQIGVAPMESLTIYDVLPFHNKDKVTFQKGDKIIKVGDHAVETSTEFHREVAANTSGSLTVTVERKLDKNGKSVSDSPEDTVTSIETIKIDDNYFRTLGLTLDSGPIAAVRVGSPADKAGLKKGDKLASLDGLEIGNQIDPMKLPIEIAKRHGQEINIIVTRQIEGAGRESVPIKLIPDDVPGWLDKPERPGEPLSIPAIGVAFHILPVVLAVAPDSAGEKAGMKSGPLRMMTLTKRSDAVPDGNDASVIEIKFKDEKDKSNNNCAFAFWMLQVYPHRKVTLVTAEDGKSHELTPQVDATWPLPMIGVRLEPRKLLLKAESFSDACFMSIKFTRNSALNIYLTLRSLGTGRVSIKELRGPFGIAETAYRVAQDGFVPMLLFLGFLSVNLAVLNFLPIPVLDGGHMVFLLWEALARRKPNENVQIGATYVGFAILLCLMGLVLYLDLFIHGFSKK